MTASPRGARIARVTGVDQDGVRLLAVGADAVVDALFDDRRIWSFWVRRDTERADRTGLVRHVAWPAVMRPHLRGTTRIVLREHVSGRVLHDGELTFGDPEPGERVRFVNKRGLDIALDKSGRFSPVFGERTAADLEPLLDTMEQVIDVLARAGVEAFPAYGTLLGAVREGRFLGHDSDADLGYVSRHTTPVDVVRESFRLQRAVVDAGFGTYRYSGAAFRVAAIEGDGSVRGLDVFGGFLDGGRLYLMGEIGTEFEESWIRPLGTCELAGRRFPAPAVPERLLEATYGPSWRVPDPAFKFETSERTRDSLNQWFRGLAVHRQEWERRYGAGQAGQKGQPGTTTGRSLAKEIAAREQPGTRVLDVGAGRGRDAIWLARRGFPVTAYDYVPRALTRAARIAVEEELPFEARSLNLDEWRSLMSEGARLARASDAAPVPTVIHARHLLDATDTFGRSGLGRFAAMTLRGGGRLYAEWWTGRGEPEPGLTALSAEQVVGRLERFGGRITSIEEFEAGARGNARPFSVGRVIASWA
ncbi:hypothetical protein GCM10022215_10520 [Nocardioides fonticola]|uniref:Class I SAM-dependent methyltransferase n=1 Tax=Nocardioides fonticola TaxID=450363 RepID=A0ABP7XEX0_9ACTN